MSQDTPSLQVRCTGCNTSFKMKLKRGRIPTKVVPCPKCKSPIDLNQYTEADIETEQPLSGLAKRLRPAAELLKTIIPQARIFDRSKNRKRKIDATAKEGPGFHLQKGGPNEAVSLPDSRSPERPGLVVGRIAPALETPEAVDLRKTPYMGVEQVRRAVAGDESIELLDSGMLTKTPDSVEIDLSQPRPRHTPAPSLDIDSDVSADILADLIEGDIFDSLMDPPAMPKLPKPAQVAEHAPAGDLPSQPKLVLPKIQPPKIALADFKPLSQAPSFKLPAPISGSSESSESHEAVVANSTIEVSDALKNSVEIHRFETKRPAEDQSLELLRNASFSNELENEQAESFFKSSGEIAESMEFEIEEFDFQEQSRAPFSLFTAILVALVVFAVVVGFLTLT
jgi:hypothetical protein